MIRHERHVQLRGGIVRIEIIGADELAELESHWRRIDEIDRQAQATVEWYKRAADMERDALDEIERMVEQAKDKLGLTPPPVREVRDRAQHIADSLSYMAAQQNVAGLQRMQQDMLGFGLGAMQGQQHVPFGNLFGGLGLFGQRNHHGQFGIYR